MAGMQTQPKRIGEIRDDHAAVLGEIVQLGVRLAAVAIGRPQATVSFLGTQEYTSLLATLIQIVQPGLPSSTLIDSPISSIPALSVLAESLPALDIEHIQLLQDRNLLRPSRLTQIWPRLLLFPALAFYVYTSRTSWVPAIVEMAKDFEDTITGFGRGWLVEPLLGVLHTVQAGGKGEVLVTKEGVIADLEPPTHDNISGSGHPELYTFPARYHKVYPEVLSDHAVRLHFKYRPMNPFYGIKISEKPLLEWHAFATIHDEDENGKITGFFVVVSNAGDWTNKLIHDPPKKLWIRGYPLHGLLYRYLDIV